MTRRDDERLNIIHLTAPARFGGLESVVQALAAGHARRGHRVAVVAVLATDEPGRHPMLETLRDTGVTVFEIRLPARSYLRERKRIVEICRLVEPDIVHTHGYRSDVVGGSAAHRLRIPAVATLHGFTGGGWKNRCYERLQIRGLSRFAAVVAVSRHLAERLAATGVPPDRLHCVSNAWDGRAGHYDRAEAREKLGVDAAAFLIGWVGRLSREKGADLLLDGLAGLSELPVSASFLGEGPEREALERQTRTLRLTDRVRWHGSVPEAWRLYPAFDCLALSSRTEGTPIVLFEAMAAWVPIVATNVGGVGDVVSGEEALLVPPRSPKRLSAALRAVFDDRAEAGLRAERAKRRLDTHYSTDRWLEEYEAVYRTVLGSTHGAARS